MIDREDILNRWARRDAAKSIAADGDGVTVKMIHRIIQSARAAGDERASFRYGNEAAGRSLPVTAKTARKRARAKSRQCAPDYRVPSLSTFGIHKRTIYVRRLGVGSADCLLIPISVSCLPTERECHHG